jgi:hypothetical protein
VSTGSLLGKVQYLNTCLLRHESRAGHGSVQVGFGLFDHPTRACQVWKTQPTIQIQTTKYVRFWVWRGRLIGLVVVDRVFLMGIIYGFFS